MRKIILIVASALVISACGEDAPPPTVAPVAVAKKKEVVVETPTAAAIEYTFNSLGKRDPFRSPVFEGPAASGGVTAGNPCSEPLCQFDLDELTVVAVVSGDSNPLAMVQDRTNVGHIVRKNTKMGKSNGKVTQILRECVVVTSFVTGPDGKSQPNRQEMCVKVDARSAPPTDLLQGKPYQ
jgi:type IV pilus assembly protein PilP